jgi:hypothetical protein
LSVLAFRVIGLRNNDDGGSRMIVQPYDRPTEMQLSSMLQGLDAGNTESSLSPFAGGNFAGSDAISRMLPPFNADANDDMSQYSGPFGSVNGTNIIGMLGGMISQLSALLQQMTGRMYGGPGCGGNEQYFQNADGGSVGDPHLSFNGNKWDSMVSQPDLLNSNSIPGGFRVSTQVTAPNANGVTHNQSVTVATGFGGTSVSLDKNGNATVVENGTQIPIANGQTLQLGNETVTRNQDGSLQVIARNGTGGSITTTLRSNGNGVDVDFNAQNVDLGGDLVNGQNGAQPQPVHMPPLPIGIRPIPGPILPPIVEPYDGSRNPFQTLD